MAPTLRMGCGDMGTWGPRIYQMFQLKAILDSGGSRPPRVCEGATKSSLTILPVSPNQHGMVHLSINKTADFFALGWNYTFSFCREEQKSMYL